jgi:N-acetyl-anhydromuramyl-L-alanine amidase AmpD
MFLIFLPSASVPLVVTVRDLPWFSYRQFEARFPFLVNIFQNAKAARRQIWVVTAERSDAGRFIVRADEKLTAFVELESTIHDSRRTSLKR